MLPAASCRVAALLVAVLLTAATACAPRPQATSPAASAAMGASAFVGTWALAATNQIPERSRFGMVFAPADSGLAVSFIQGPPGRARSVQVAGDSLVVLWSLPGGGADYRVALRARGDSVAGTWAGPEGSGALSGRRQAP